MQQSLIKYLFIFILLTLAQVIFFQNYQLFDTAYVFIYPAFIIFLPAEISVITLLLLAFGQGLLIDIFYSTMGFNTFALVLLAYLRLFLLKTISPKEMNDVNQVLKFSQFEWTKLVFYISVLIFIHHSVLLFMLNADFSNTPMVMLKILTSVFLSTFGIFFIKIIFLSKL